MPEEQPGSPLWWLNRLHKQLTDRWKVIAKYDRYYRGEHDLRFASSQFEKTFGGLFLDAADNFMPLIVDSVQERLRVEGFRLGENVSGDRRAWRIWQDNNMDADAVVAQTEALIHGDAYTLVWGDEEGNPRIWVEHPSQVIVAHAPDDRRRRTAALKCWTDEYGEQFATIYLPGAIYKYRSKAKVANVALGPWQERRENGEPWPLPNPLGVVPIVPLSARRRMLGDGTSEIANVIGLQDKVNKLTFDLLIASEFAAFRQRWATGLDIPKDPDTGKPIETLEHAVNRLWVSTSKDTSFGEFQPTDLKNYVEAVEMHVQHIAVQSRTPPHYLFLRGNMPSGESLRSAETGLVKKARERMVSFGEGWEETMRLALRVAGINARGAASMETKWADPESRTESEHVDGVMKRLALGIPLRQLWEDLGYSPEEIARFSQMLAEEAVYRAQLDALGRDLATTPPSPNGSEPEPAAMAGE